ncbi:MAG: SRPBCC family protein [Povalibacter sp.]
MSLVHFKTSTHRSVQSAPLARPALMSAALVVLSAVSSIASAASVSHTVDVQGTPSQVWSFIGPFCAIKDWLPPVGTCSEDGKTPPTRTLVTKDGTATFVELQTARSDQDHFYTYSFVSSPLPVSQYSSTIKVVAKGAGSSTIIWRGTYTPVQGQEKAADDALSGIYHAGLDSIVAKMAAQVH